MHACKLLMWQLCARKHGVYHPLKFIKCPCSLYVAVSGNPALTCNMFWCVQGAENDKILVENIAPAWALLIAAVSDAVWTSSPENVYR